MLTHFFSFFSWYFLRIFTFFKENTFFLQLNNEIPHFSDGCICLFYLKPFKSNRLSDWNSCRWIWTTFSTFILQLIDASRPLSIEASVCRFFHVLNYLFFFFLRPSQVEQITSIFLPPFFHFYGRKPFFSTFKGFVICQKDQLDAIDLQLFLQHPHR